MILSIDYLKKLNPSLCNGDFTSGVSNNLPNIEKGKIYRAKIIEFLSKNGKSTNNVISSALGLGKRKSAAVLQKMVKSGLLETPGKEKGLGVKPCYSYRVTEKGLNYGK